MAVCTLFLNGWKAYHLYSLAMADTAFNSTLRRLRNRYRLIVLNEDTYEELVRFKLSRVGVYATFSVLFILMTALISAIIIFTPLKYYLPGVGMGDAKQIKEYRSLKLKTDSLERALVLQDKYFQNLNNVLGGKIVPKDTAVLPVKKEAEPKKRSRRKK